MRAADVLVSEASSAMFEFAALDRPIVWCDFVKLRWQHRGPLRFRFEARMDRSIERYADIGAHAATPGALAGVIRAELAAPARHAPKRRQYTAELIGPTDGRTGERIAAVMLDGAT
jgi:CDP-glycerol glycerophosphotransferase (TagB/SpsB family)